MRKLPGGELIERLPAASRIRHKLSVSARSAVYNGNANKRERIGVAKIFEILLHATFI